MDALQKTLHNTRVCLIFWIASHAAFVCAAPNAEDRVQFNRDIRPLLAQNCFACHGPDEQAREAELRLDTAEGALADLGGYVAVAPGDVASSALVERISSADPDARMPPPDAGKQLSAEQIELIRRWIAEGAVWQAHWSFIPPERSALPPAIEGAPAENPIDRFVQARLEQEGLTLAANADRATRVRRVTLDLIGLLPTPAEVAAFVDDDRADAYERLVDRLLTSPQYGERMATVWLDAARYSDSFGYHEDWARTMWPWRDWVISAFNDNMPYDQFTTEQLAGDLLPEAAIDQRIASGFNRLHGLTSSGLAEEYRVESVIDRIKTISTVWLGLTVGCAQCHDHKYDPLTQQEFYELFAFFNQGADPAMMPNNSGNVAPMLAYAPTDVRRQIAGQREKIGQLEALLNGRRAESAEPFADWLIQVRDQPPTGATRLGDGLVLYCPLNDSEGTAVHDSVSDKTIGAVVGPAAWTEGRQVGALAFDGEATYVDLGDAVRFERTDPFSYGAWIYLEGEGGGAALSRMDDANAYRGFDLFLAGRAVEVHIVSQWPSDALHCRMVGEVVPGEWHHVFVTYDGSSQASGIKLYLDGQLSEVNVTQDHLTGTIVTEKPFHIGRRNPSGFFHGRIDDVRVYNRALSAAEVAQVAQLEAIDAILARPETEWTDQQRQTLEHYFLASHDDSWQSWNSEKSDAETAIQELTENLPTVMVMQELDEPRETRFLNRGLYDQPGETVSPGTPSSLPPLPDGAPRNRLGFARWLVDPGHPLTARVAVNQLWQICFGAGLVKTADDFGTQGEFPSHPELLDWLAVEFIDSGWDVKALLRLIVTSQTYQQSSQATPELRVRDPENRLLACGPRYRLPAEMIRDNALAVSGLLIERIGGPSVKPYQPAGLWKEMRNDSYEQDHGSALYRRSLYTYRKRSVPPPSLNAFDAPDRETSCVRRQRTNTPLMALVTLNDPTFVEAARALAQRLLTEGPMANASPEQRFARAFQLTLARDPKPAEAEVFMRVLRRQQSVYAQDQAAAAELITVGESPRDEQLDAAEHAAWTVVANVLLNMDEFLTKE